MQTQSDQTQTTLRNRVEAALKSAGEQAMRNSNMGQIKSYRVNHLISLVEREVAAERERIAAAIDGEAEVCPCHEDAQVLRDTALLVRANFSYEDAEQLERADA